MVEREEERDKEEIKRNLLNVSFVNVSVYMVSVYLRTYKFVHLSYANMRCSDCMQKCLCA